MVGNQSATDEKRQRQPFCCVHVTTLLFSLYCCQRARPYLALALLQEDLVGPVEGLLNGRHRIDWVVLRREDLLVDVGGGEGGRVLPGVAVVDTVEGDWRFGRHLEKVHLNVEIVTVAESRNVKNPEGKNLPSSQLQVPHELEQ